MIIYDNFMIKKNSEIFFIDSLILFLKIYYLKIIIGWKISVFKVCNLAWQLRYGWYKNFVRTKSCIIGAREKIIIEERSWI